MEAAQIPSTHRAHVFQTKEEVLCLWEMVWLGATFSELLEKSCTATQTTHALCNYAGKNMNGAWGVSFLAVLLPIPNEMGSPH